MCVGLVAHLAKIGLVARVHVHVLLSVAAIGKASVAALELALEGLLPWRERREGERSKYNKSRSCLFVCFLTQISGKMKTK